MSEIACNIGPKSISMRKRTGMLLIIIAGFTSGFLIATDAPTVSRLVVFPLFMAGFVSLLQAARKVCVYHAWKKTKNMN